MFYLWPQSQENAKNSFRETSFKNDSIAKVHLDAEQATNSGKVSLNMGHWACFRSPAYAELYIFLTYIFPITGYLSHFLLKVKSL